MLVCYLTLVLLAFASPTCLGRPIFSAPKLQPLNSGAPIIPWLQPPSWTPPYAGLTNDLDALLKAQSTEDRWVTIFCLSIQEGRKGTLEEASFERVFVNSLFSYRAFGQASSEIVAAINPAALANCQKFRLPCFNASTYAADARSFKNINWAKIKLARDVLKLGYNVHISDLDVSYLKPLQLAIREIFSWSNGAADGSMMQEEWVHQDAEGDPASRRPIYVVNTGVIFLRANPRSVGFLESMLRWESDQNQEQYMATVVAYQSWAPCSEEATCLAVRHRGMAAITRHPAQFAHDNCAPEPRYDLCDSRRLYAHAVCRSSSRDKEGYLRYLRAMFIRDLGVGGAAEGSQKAAAALSDPGVVGQQDNEAIAASGLPCPQRQQRAWRDRFYSSYTAVESARGGKDGDAKVSGSGGVEDGGGGGGAQLRGGGVMQSGGGNAAEAAGGLGAGQAAAAAAVAATGVSGKAAAWSAQLDAGAAALAAQQAQERAGMRHHRPKGQE